MPLQLGTQRLRELRMETIFTKILFILYTDQYIKLKENTKTKMQKKKKDR